MPILRRSGIFGSLRRKAKDAVRFFGLRFFSLVFAAMFRFGFFHGSQCCFLCDKHAETSALCRYSVSAAAKEKCIKRHEMLVKMGLELSCGELTVRVPVDGTDIIAEGAKLSHCVGGYAKKHANGKTTILFIRKKSDPDTPYFTLEIDVKTGKIMQCYGYKNRESYKATPSVARICSKLTKKIQQLNQNNERQKKTA